MIAPRLTYAYPTRDHGLGMSDVRDLAGSTRHRPRPKASQANAEDEKCGSGPFRTSYNDEKVHFFKIRMN